MSCSIPTPHGDMPTWGELVIREREREVSLGSSSTQGLHGRVGLGPASGPATPRCPETLNRIGIGHGHGWHCPSLRRRIACRHGASNSRAPLISGIGSAFAATERCFGGFATQVLPEAFSMGGNRESLGQKALIQGDAGKIKRNQHGQSNCGTMTSEAEFGMRIKGSDNPLSIYLRWL